jgi:hypothetical protein
MEEEFRAAHATRESEGQEEAASLRAQAVAAIADVHVTLALHVVALVGRGWQPTGKEIAAAKEKFSSSSSSSSSSSKKHTSGAAAAAAPPLEDGSAASSSASAAAGGGGGVGSVPASPSAEARGSKRKSTGGGVGKR